MIKKHAKPKTHIRRRSELPERRSPEQILSDLGMTREQVQEAATNSALNAAAREYALKGVVV